MNEENTIKMILESKADQKLRECLSDNSKVFEAVDDIHKRVLEKYDNMNEEQKKSFVSKGWKNE